MADEKSSRLQPVRLQKGSFPPLANSAGSLLLSRHKGKDVLCMKTFIEFIDLESPSKYYGTLENQMKTVKFEVKRRIIGVDGDIASFEVKFAKLGTARKQFCTIAPKEGTVGSNPDVYIVSERGEDFIAHIVKWRNNSDLAVCLERGIRDDLPKGCPVYDNENQVIGLIKYKIYGSLWAVKWFSTWQLAEEYAYAFDEYSEESTKEEHSNYQSILSFGDLFFEGCKEHGFSQSSEDPCGTPSEEKAEPDASKDDHEKCYFVNDSVEVHSVETDAVEAKGAAESCNYAIPFDDKSSEKGSMDGGRRKMCCTRHHCSTEMLEVKQQLFALKNRLDDFAKLFEASRSALAEEKMSERQGWKERGHYAALYTSPTRNINTSNKGTNFEGAAGNSSELVRGNDEYSNRSNETVAVSNRNVSNSKIYIDGKSAMSRNGGKKDKTFEDGVKDLCISAKQHSEQNEYIILDDQMQPIQRKPATSGLDSSKKHTWQNFNQDVTVNQIGPNILHELALELDDKDWERVASGLGVTEEVIKQLKAHRSGKCCAALEFLQNLITKYPEERLIDFRQKVIEIERNDVVGFIDSSLGGMMANHLHEIPRADLEALAVHLEHSQFISIKYWKHLAGLYGYDNNVIGFIENKVVCTNHPHSPTAALVDYVRKCQPALCVSEIGAVLEKLGLNRTSQKLHHFFEKQMLHSSLPNLVRNEFLPI